MNILITGASSGIGRFLAGRLSSLGHEIWGLGRSASPHGDPAAGDGLAFRYSACDVSDWGQVDRLRQEIGQTWKNVGALICCAGIQSPIGPAMDCDPEAWSKNLRTNLDGVFFTIRAFHDLMKGPPGGRAKVLCFSGGGAASPRPNFAAYSCAKAAIVRLAENLSIEWAGLPIDINSVAPGAIETGMTRQILQCGEGLAGTAEMAAARKLSGNGGQGMSGVGDLVEFLLSGQSDGITGRLISAPWDPWRDFKNVREKLGAGDVLTLRRIVPSDRGWDW